MKPLTPIEKQILDTYRNHTAKKTAELVGVPLSKVNYTLRKIREAEEDKYAEVWRLSLIFGAGLYAAFTNPQARAKAAELASQEEDFTRIGPPKDV